MSEKVCPSCSGSGIQNTLEIQVNEKGEITGHTTVVRTCESCAGQGRIWE